jgi:hypothetical protein
MENTSNAASASMFAFVATLGIFAVVISIAWYILQVVAYWRIFTKAGKPGWHSIIPFLNNWDLIDLSWSRTIAWVGIAAAVITSCLYSPAYAEDASTFVKVIFWVASVVSAVIAIVTQYKLAKAFGKGVGFFLGLLFLNPIFKLILGFGDARYQGRQE